MKKNDNIEEMKKHLLEYVESITVKKSKNRKNYRFICPFCGGGTAKGSKGSLYVNSETNKFYCYECFAEGDIFDLIEKHEKIDDFHDCVKRASEFTGIPINDDVDEDKGLKEDWDLKELPDNLHKLIEIIKGGNTKSGLSTGFKELDETLGGGLYEGLYIIGAMPSLGKTTFALQIADRLAQSGEDVLIFPLEMSEFELMAKSISRETYEIAHETEMERPERMAKTTRELLCGIRYKDISKAEENLIDKAIMKYCDYAERIFIFEGMGDFGVEQVRKAVATHINITGKLPVVIVDYLQILAMCENGTTDKQNIDKVVTELKRISRDFKITLIGISSLNRASYNSTVSMESFKESGAIEYASDVLIGLQYAGAGEKDFDINKASRAFQRDVELVVLKNRNGLVGETIKYKYIPMYNQFCEVDVTTEDIKERATVPNMPKF